jgi:hypothetical protein
MACDWRPLSHLQASKQGMKTLALLGWAAVPAAVVSTTCLASTLLPDWQTLGPHSHQTDFTNYSAQVSTSNAGGYGSITDTSKGRGTAVASLASPTVGPIQNHACTCPCSKINNELLAQQSQEGCVA